MSPKWLTYPSVIACLLASASAAASVTFHDLSIDEAVERAVAEDKAVFVDFFAAWCAPCKVMDTITFQDADVAAWLDENTVALRIDREANEPNKALAERYGVRSFPNYVFISPNGNVMDRITGVRMPEQFIKESESIVRGESVIDRARAALAEGSPKNPILRSRLASAYAELGQDEDALREYLWCFDEGEKHLGAYRSMRLSVLLHEIKRLGHRYPPALEALVERRQRAEQRIVDGSAEPDDIAVYTSINRTVDKQEASLALYNRIKHEDTLNRPTFEALADEVFDLLMVAGSYKQIMAEYDLLGRIEEAFKTYNTTMKVFRDFDALFDKVGDQLDDFTKEMIQNLRDRPAARDSIRQSRVDLLRRQVASSYQVLVGAGLLEDAAAVAQRLTDELDDAETQNVLAWAGYLTGSPVEANLVQARRAFELSGGENVAIMDTLARVLASLSHRDEAISVAESGLRKAETPHDRQAMTDCLDFCLNHHGRNLREVGDDGA